MPRVTAQYVHGDGSPRSGRIHFAPSTTVVGEERIILPAPLTVELDAHGALAVDLVGTDDPDYSPAGWVWTVTEAVHGGRPPYSMTLTDDVDLSEVSPVVPPDEYVTLVPTARTITAGAGLTGGGTLAADRTLSVGAGVGIVVDADTVSVDTDVIATVGALADEVTDRESADSALAQSLSDEADARVAGDEAASDALAAHAGDATGVHGIADTAALVLDDDPRLSDARPPTGHTHPAGQISDSTTVGRAVVTAADAAAARSAISAAQAGAAPATHAASHAAAGSDPVTIAQSQVSGLTDALDAKAPLASPALTGNPTAPTQTAGNNSTRLATTAYVDTAAGLLVPKSMFDANTILAATTDDTPAALSVPASTLVGRAASGGIAALTPAQMFALAPATPPATTGAELGSGSGLTQTVTTVIGSTYLVGGSGVTAITLDGVALVVSSGYSSFVATGTSHTLVGTGGTNLSVGAITLGSRTAVVTLASVPVRAGSLSSLALGVDAQRSLTTGSYNNALGYTAQYSLTTGSYNNALGHTAQYSLTTGSYNNALGHAAQRSLTTGSYNNALGHAAQNSLTTGSYNNALGYSAQRSLTTGSSNNALGFYVQYSLTTGSYNNALGYSAQYSLTTGSSNNALGHAAQYSLTTGSSNNALGYAAQNSLTTGSSNNALGYGAQQEPKGLSANATTTANYQTAVGHQSGQYAAGTGDKGVAVGYRALYHTGAVAVGSDAEAQGTDSIAIGRGAIAAAANAIQIGAVGTAYTLAFGNAGRVIGLVELKSIAAASADFAAFKAAIAALT